MSAQGPVAMGRKIIIGASLHEAVSQLLRNKVVFLRLTAIPVFLAICLIAYLYGTPFLQVALAPRGPGPLPTLSQSHPFLMQAGSALLFAVFGYGWMRAHLAGAESSPPPILPKLSTGLLMFVLVFIVALIVWELPAMLTGPQGYRPGAMRHVQNGPSHYALTSLLFIGRYVVAPVLAIRFCLVLPAAAIGAHLSLKRSWARTRGQFWRLTLLAAAIFVPAAVAIGLLGNLLAASLLVTGVWLPRSAELDAGANSNAPLYLFGELLLGLTIVVMLKFVTLALAMSALVSAHRVLGETPSTSTSSQ